MIFYFSATGNCKYVAKRIADVTSDKLISITNCMKQKSFSFSPKENEAIGIITPTYAWGLPIIVADFLQMLALETSHKPYLFFIATYGTTSGQTGLFANQYLERKGLALDARFSVQMPDTWTPTYNLSNSKKVKRLNIAAEPQIDFIIDKVKSRSKGDFMHRKVPLALAKLFYRKEYDSMRKTNHFIVEDTCIGCGLCARKCPVSAIEIQSEKPVWIRDQCVMCLACLHHCPKFAIQYGKNTKKHGQYIHPPYKSGSGKKRDKKEL